MARQFGIVSGATGVTGCILNSVKRGTSVQTAEARDASGKLTDKWFYSRENTVSLSGVLDAENLTVSAGDKLSYAGKDYGVNSTSVDETNTGAATFSIEGATADAAELHTYAAASPSGE